MLGLTMMMMGIATCCIGLLATYAVVGPWAAVVLVLLRIVQGFGVGGQWGGAVLMAVEHAPAGKRGFYGSWAQIGVPSGLLNSTILFLLFSKIPPGQFLSWGLCVPFLLSLVPVGLRAVVSLSDLPT